MTTPCAFEMAHGLDSVNSFQFESVIRGFHVYQKVWEPQLNEELHCLLEPANEYDKNAVAIVRDDCRAHTAGELESVCILYSARRNYQM